MTLAADKLTQAKIALFANGAYVDKVAESAPGEPEAEAEFKNIKATLKAQDHEVSTFSGISADGLAAALAGKDVVLIPELEIADLASNLAADAAEVIRDFVATGHTLIINGAEGDRDTDFLNAVFNFGVNNGVPLNQLSIAKNAIASTDTAFADDPDEIIGNGTTFTLNGGALPGGALNVYDNGGNAAVVVFAHGGGQVAYLGWDWFDAKPRGEQDAGWLKVLDSAISQPDGPGVQIMGTASDDLVNQTQTVAGQPMPTIRADTISGNEGEDRLSGLAGADAIYGGDDNDLLFGGAGNDKLRGMGGDDTLNGGKGKDEFIYDNDQALTGVDTIIRFKTGIDTIVLDPQVFEGLPSEPGQLKGSAFHIGNEATRATHRIIYDDDTGQLFYDPDGDGGAAQIHFATLDPDVALTHRDFDLQLFA